MGLIATLANIYYIHLKTYLLSIYLGWKNQQLAVVCSQHHEAFFTIYHPIACSIEVSRTLKRRSCLVKCVWRKDLPTHVGGLKRHDFLDSLSSKGHDYIICQITGSTCEAFLGTHLIDKGRRQECLVWPWLLIQPIQLHQQRSFQWCCVVVAQRWRNLHLPTVESNLPHDWRLGHI